MKDRLHRTGAKKLNHTVKSIGGTCACVLFSFALIITVVAVNVSESNRYVSDNIVTNYVLQQAENDTSVDEYTLLPSGS